MCVCTVRCRVHRIRAPILCFPLVCFVWLSSRYSRQYKCKWLVSTVAGSMRFALSNVDWPATISSWRYPNTHRHTHTRFVGAWIAESIVKWRTVHQFPLLLTVAHILCRLVETGLVPCLIHIHQPTGHQRTILTVNLPTKSTSPKILRVSILFKSPWTTITLLPYLHHLISIEICLDFSIEWFLLIKFIECVIVVVMMSTTREWPTFIRLKSGRTVISSRATAWWTAVSCSKSRISACIRCVAVSMKRPKIRIPTSTGNVRMIATCRLICVCIFWFCCGSIWLTHSHKTGRTSMSILWKAHSDDWTTGFVLVVVVVVLCAIEIHFLSNLK